MDQVLDGHVVRVFVKMFRETMVDGWKYTSQIRTNVALMTINMDCWEQFIGCKSMGKLVSIWINWGGGRLNGVLMCSVIGESSEFITGKDCLCLM